MLLAAIGVFFALQNRIHGRLVFWPPKDFAAGARPIAYPRQYRGGADLFCLGPSTPHPPQ